MLVAAPAAAGELANARSFRAAVDNRQPERDRHTTLLAHYDGSSADADYARTFRENSGPTQLAQPGGKFGGGVTFRQPDDFIQYEGLDNINRLEATVEFWVRSDLDQPMWNDGKTHWLFAVYPERGDFGPAAGMAPYHIGLFKSRENDLVLSVVQKRITRYDFASSLIEPGGWQVRVPVGSLTPAEWHHVAFSFSLRPPGRLVLAADDRGVSLDLDLAPEAASPNPAYKIYVGGISAVPLAPLLGSNCTLDELRIEDTAPSDQAAARPDAAGPHDLLQAEDTVRAVLDRLLALREHGGWHDFYQWPTYQPAEWGWIGRGVNLWFSTNHDAGDLLLRAWLLWGDDRYLDAAADLARMYSETQLPNGGWNFYYAYTRGQYIPYRQGALIAQEMQTGPIRFLAFYAGLTHDAAALSALQKSVDFFVTSQGAEGWWGWRAIEEGPSFPAALNDGVTTEAIQDLFVLYRVTGDERCLAAIRRAVKWIESVQLPAPTFGWADQYEATSASPIWNRPYEPPAVSTQAISSVAPVLFMMYDITGEERYLQPLRATLRWLNSVPERQRGWLWYDRVTAKPVVAWDMKMYAVDAPIVKSEILPKLANYGVKFQWPGRMISAGLEARDRNGPLYPGDVRTGWTGGLTNGEWTPRSANQAEGWLPRRQFSADHGHRKAAEPTAAMEVLAPWLAGRSPSAVPQSVTYSDPVLIARSRYEGQQFQPMEALRLATGIMDWIEASRAELGDVRPDLLPRYDPRVWGAWVYAHPAEDLYAVPLGKQSPEPRATAAPRQVTPPDS